MRELVKYRLLEIFPGTLVWITFALAIVFSFIQPLWVMAFIIIYDAYWLVRLLYLEIFLIIGYTRYRKALRVDWKKILEGKPGFDDVYHIVLYPTYKESLEVMETSFEALRLSQYPNMKDRMIVVLAGEEADKENFLQIAASCEKRYAQYFKKFLITLHPSNVPGELPGKGSNIHYAGKKFQEYCDQESIPYTKVLVSSFDADTRVHPMYFSYLTCVYLDHPRRLRSSYQPNALFNNNVWDAPSFARVVSFSTTFWLMTEQIRPERLFTFSSHSMPLQALVDVGFWQNDIVTEDSRICLQCMQHYDGDYEVTPLYIPVSMDVVLGKSLWQTIKSQYIQQRRWAYGAENFPFMVWNFLPNKKMAWTKKIRYIWNQFEGSYSWATAPILIFILGRLPLLALSEVERQSALALNTPHILQILLRFSLLGVILSAVLGTTLLPKRPKGVPRRNILYMIIQWPLILVSMIFFGSLPAADALTRLMFGKYLGFEVTQKIRKRSAV